MSDSGKKINGTGLRIALVVIGCLTSALLGANLVSSNVVLDESGRRLKLLEIEDIASRDDRRLLDVRVTSMETFLRSMDAQNTISHRDILDAIREMQKKR